MTADDAFDKLLAKNALNIPVARPTPRDSGVVREDTAVPTAEQVRERTPDPEAPTGPRAMKVDNVFDGSVDDLDDFIDAQEVGPFAGITGDEDDYRPPMPRTDDDAGVFSTPTETDLDAVLDGGDDELEMADAHRHGALVVGRDADQRDNEDEFALPDYSEDDDRHDSEYGDLDDADYDDKSDRPLPPSAEEAGLRLARTVRRFSFLPLTGMDEFNSGARDLVASLRSQNPERPSLAVTAPRRGDGQTEIAIRLGLAAAKRVDYRILLVDFDVRRPQMAVRLGVTAKYFTLTDVLRGACRFGEALTYSEEDNLYILPARPTDRPGDEVVDDRQVAAFFRAAHAVFDFTIVVCGSLDHPDPVIVCRHAGAAALAGYCGFSRVGALRDAVGTLTEAGVKVAGMLLTGA